MMRNLMLAAALFASTSAIAAEVSPEQRSQIEALIHELSDIRNAPDVSAAVNKAYADNAISVNSFGLKRGQSEVTNGLLDLKKMGLMNVKFEPKIIEQLEGTKNIIAVSSYAGALGANQVTGNVVHIFQPDGPGWKVRVTAASRLLPRPDQSK